MKIVQFLLNLLRMLFGGRKAALPEAETREEKPAETEAVDAEENAPKTDDAAEGLEGDGVSDATEEPEDEPQDDFDDVEYDVEHETEDDDTEREPLPEPDPDTVERVERKIAPSPEWRNRQRWLKDLGYDPGPVDGKPGRRTQGALKEFQSDRGLLPDGVWGPKTQAAMVAALKDKEDAEKPRVPPPPSVSRPPSTEPASSVPGAYEDMIGDVELDDGFWASFVDLTSKSNFKDGNGRRRRKGKRRWKNLTRICWHQTAFTWKTYRELKASKSWSSHHKINSHVCVDTDGTILLIHNFLYYLWTANSFNTDCLSFEIMGNFEGELGTGNWYRPDTFGRARPERIQIVRSRQLTKWLMNPELGPSDEDLPKPLLEWRQAVRDLGFNPLKWNNAHRQATSGRVLDCGSECWYHVVMWGIAKLEGLSEGPEKGKGMKIPPEWYEKPPVPPLS
jgi:hypothetical protein